MSTKPHHTYDAIATDAERLAATALEDVHDKVFGKHVDSHELVEFKANIAKLKSASASRPSKLDAQVGAGVHVAQICASLGESVRHIRDAAALEWIGDKTKSDETKARAFGYGRVLDTSTVSSVESFALAQLASAEADPKSAAQVGLDKKSIHHLHDLLTSLEGADIAHVHTKADRHEATTSLDSLAHLVSAESAHIRFVATRVFRGDETKLARYESTLPRREVKHKTRLAPGVPVPVPVP